jgi:ribosomal protein S18 acetylase RimI-like enzyme
MMKRTFEKLLDMGKRQVALLGGVRKTNSRAMAFYRKLGFQRVATFEWEGIFNDDMLLNLV